MLVEGEPGLLTQMAGCCKPAPPDAIVGYITQGPRRHHPPGRLRGDPAPARRAPGPGTPGRLGRQGRGSTCRGHGSGGPGPFQLPAQDVTEILGPGKSMDSVVRVNTLSQQDAARSWNSPWKWPMWPSSPAAWPASATSRRGIPPQEVNPQPAKRCYIRIFFVRNTPTTPRREMQSKASLGHVCLFFASHAGQRRRQLRCRISANHHRYRQGAQSGSCSRCASCCMACSICTWPLSKNDFQATAVAARPWAFD